MARDAGLIHSSVIGFYFGKDRAFVFSKAITYKTLVNSEFRTACSMVLPFSAMDNFRFILENPHPNATNAKQRKRARLVTACDSCRVKKIKCQQTTPNGRCEACKIAKTPCLFGDRDRYQAERGVSCAWSPSVQDILPAVPTPSSSNNSDPSSRRPKSAYYPYPSAHSPRLTPTPTSGSGTPSTFPSNYSLPPDLSHSDSSLKNAVHTNTAYPQILNSLNDYTPFDHVVDDIPLFDPLQPRFPNPQRMYQLATLFFDTIADSFPFLDRLDILHRIERKTCSAILANCIASLALRYTSNPGDPPIASRFYDMAKNLAVNVVSMPSIEALHALICITWFEYSLGEMDTYWAFSRMAITMCLDLSLGYEATIQVATTPEVQMRLRLTWWTVVCIADISASWATGRPTIIDLGKYDTQFPQGNDDRTIMFRNMTRLYLLRARIGLALDSYATSRSDSPWEWSLSESQLELEQIIKSLPPSLTFSVENLARAKQCDFASPFLHLHFLIQAMTILINQPALLAYDPLMTTHITRIETARSSAKYFMEILMILQDIIVTPLQEPFMDLPLLVAIQFLTLEIQTFHVNFSDNTKPWQTVMYSFCKDALLSLSSYCGNIRPFETLLKQKGGPFHSKSFLSDAEKANLFTVSNSNMDWLLRPALIDDSSSDTSGSFRSPSREISPFMIPDTTPSCETPFTHTITSLVRSVDRGGMSTRTKPTDSNFGFLPLTEAPFFYQPHGSLPWPPTS